MCHGPLFHIIKNHAAGVCVSSQGCFHTGAMYSSGNQSIKMHSFVLHHNASSSVNTVREKKMRTKDGSYTELLIMEQLLAAESMQ